MFLEGPELLKTVLDDPTYGFNAGIGSIPLVGNDTAAVYLKPVKAVLTPSQNREVAEGELPEGKSPVLIVSIDEPLILQAFVYGQKRGANRYPLTTRYVTSESDPVKRYRQTCYALRQIVRSFRLLIGDVDMMPPAQTLNGVQFVTADTVTAMPIHEEYGSLKATGAAVINFTEVRDVAP